MKTVQSALNDDSFLTQAEFEEKKWESNSDVSNIISLAEAGFLLPTLPVDDFQTDFSPLNEW